MYWRIAAFSVSTSPLSRRSAGTYPLGFTALKIGAVLELLGGEVHLDQVERHTGFVQGDIRSERAGAGGEVELHELRSPGNGRR